MRRLFCVLAFSVACGGDKAPSAPAQPKLLEIDNYLYAKLNVRADGVGYGGVPAGYLSPAAVTFTLPASTRTLTYSLLPFQYADGSAVPGDFSSETLTLPSGDLTLSVNNIVNGQPFYAFYLSNTSGVTLNIGIASNGLVRCLGSLPTGSGQYYGYYALTNTSEVRIYPNGSNCSGTRYRFWTNAQVSAYEVNTGVLSLSASVAP